MSNLTIEQCPHCDEEVEIPEDKRSLCPSCRVPILPCSACPIAENSPDRCDWTEDGGCRIFPAKNNLT